VQERADVVVAAGGDGTVNEVINGLGTSGVALGVLPLGTINVFARELGLPTNLDAAWQLATTGVPRAIDLACAEAGGQTRCFAQLAGVGFDAKAVRVASWKLKKLIGPLSYLWAGAVVLAQPRVEVQVVPDGDRPAVTGSIVLIGNGRLYGGNLALFPDARLDDGKLDVCVFERWSGTDIFRYVSSVLRGNHTRLHDVKYFQAERFECRAAVPGVPFELDGEDAGEVPVRFSVRPRALRVIAPVTPVRNGSSA
jgi:diacylglycerol kinase (ATP)